MPLELHDPRFTPWASGRFMARFGCLGEHAPRCWLQTDRAVAELCQELKGHARLMVSIQDDAFFEEFREAPIAAGSCSVWDDWPEHTSEVAEVHNQAFGRSEEAAMVDAVRRAKAATISLVAQIPPENRGRERWPIVGHVLSARSPSTARATRGVSV